MMKSARILAISAAACAVFSGALAQTKEDISAKIETTLPTNNRGGINAESLRIMFHALNGTRGQPGGIAELDVQGKLPASTLPNDLLQVKNGKLDVPGSLALQGPNAPGTAAPFFSGANVSGQPAGPENLSVFAPSWGFKYHGGPDFGNTTPVAAQTLVRCTTASDYKVYESCVNIDFYSRSGYVAKWLPNTSYGVGSKVVNGYDVFVAKTAGTSAGSGGPTGQGSTVQDGSVVWAYDGNHFTSAKSAWSLGAIAYAGSGKVWGMNPNLILGDGFRDEAYAMEIDQGNFSGYDAELVNPKFPGAEGIWLGGLYQNTGLSGISVGGFPNGQNKEMYQIGFWCKNAKAAKFSCYEDWSDSQAGFHTSSFAKKQYDAWAQSTSEVGYYANGANRTAGFLAEMSGPVGVQVRGSPTFAGIAETSNAPVAINLQGNHTTGSIVDQSATSNGYRAQGSYGYAVLNLQEAQGAGGSIGVSLRDNQRICFTGQDGCFRKTGGKLYYTSGGVDLFSVADGTGNAIFKGSVVQGQTP